MEELSAFDDLFPELVQVLTQNGFRHEETQVAMDWFKQVCEYNVPYGKKNRGLAVVQSYRHLVPDPPPAELHTARVVGWCIEWLQAFFLVADDVMDNSFTRRGKPCWFRRHDVGLEAINDSYFLESCVYALLRRHARHAPYYVTLLELFHETTLQTVVGQCLDMLTTQTQRDFALFTMDKYRAIVKWKTAFYSFWLPVACAMHMAGVDDPALHSAAQAVLLHMGEDFQMQDDYLDCYGDPAVTGKIGTDIEDCKCSWLVVKALELADDGQRQVLQTHYGRTEADSVACVKQVYDDLSLQKVYRAREEESYLRLQAEISALDTRLPHRMFLEFAAKFYRRQK